MKQEYHKKTQDDIKKTIEPLRKVTMVSKYLALILFILLPFVGGWIGYVYAPTEIKTVPSPADVQKVEQGTPLQVLQLQYMKEQKLSKDDSVYIDPIAEFLSISTDEIQDIITTKGFIQITKINDPFALVNVCNECTHGFTKILLFDLLHKKVFKDITDIFPKGDSVMWSQTPSGDFVLLAISDTTVSMYDFFNSYSQVLYKEDQKDISLCQIGMGCSADFSITNDGHIFFGRYQLNGVAGVSDLIDVVTVALPDKYRL